MNLQPDQCGNILGRIHCVLLAGHQGPCAGPDKELVILPPLCPHCDGPLTCDPQMREALAGEKHLVAQLLDRAEKAEAELESVRRICGPPMEPDDQERRR